jgi:uncharacterized membrane protein YgaE (UPF0421/DUF939 family)
VDVRGVAARTLSRVRTGAWPAAQCGLAASLAWAFSVHVLGHPQPFFASVAAVVALGLRAGQRLRRTAELALGVAIGVLVGDLLVGVIGSGTWQIGVVVTAGLIIAVAFGGSGLVVTQSGLQAVFVVALPRSPNSGFHRWQDAMVGGGFALLVAALLSTDPWREARRLRTTFLTELAATLHETADGLRVGSSERVAATLERARRMEPALAEWQDALVTGRETSRLSPLREDRADFWSTNQQLTRGLTRATRNLRVLVRRVLAALQAGQTLPPCLPDLLDELAASLDATLTGEQACARLLDIAAKLDPVALGATSLAGQIAVGQLRVAVVDLLEGLGLEHDRARNTLPRLA